MESFADRTWNTRTGAIPSDSAQSAPSAWRPVLGRSFQQRRLARSGGTVEQYKQPHLVPDLDAILSFQRSDPVSSSTEFPGTEHQDSR